MIKKLNTFPDCVYPFLLHFLRHTFFSSSSCSAKKKKKVGLWRRKTGKEKITLSRENREGKENRSCDFFFFKRNHLGLEQLKLLSPHIHTSPPPFSSWSRLTCTFWQARLCLFCCCSTGWSHQKWCSQGMFCVRITRGAKLCLMALSSHTAMCAAFLLLLHPPCVVYQERHH